MVVRVGIIGASGFTGAELLRLVAGHPDFEVVVATGDSQAGTRVADLYPSELSGGMIKRVALARALALDPEIVFLDEPTSGLDPISAGEFDQLVMTLQRTLGLTVFMVTHDLDSLKTACNRIAVLGDRKVLLVGTMDDMLASQHPWLRAYFHGKRARAVVA